ncbi:DsbA family protein [Spongiibacter sp.]|uniref:DsbA family protein n=1 Tax=Spongiibacter sp. TaxID=2024860 RepID=UPI000C37CA86|nr:DsbA family protein [Spongiibacter sp.]MAY37876.1 disulfide bond formation protein DsbA [Spongiibacter sp.]|tara:strand:+ start:1133 stop:1897 length:765 start_codon:yes stop_codon:yes gene_type:complete
MSSTYSRFILGAIFTAIAVLLFSVAHLNSRLDLLESQPSIEMIVAQAVSDARANDARREARDRLSALRESAKLAPEFNEDGLLYGSPSARFTISVFTDIECPYCRKMHPEVKRVVDSSDGVINWKILHFPLNKHNPVAAVEAQALECVKDSYGNRTAWAFLDAMIADTGGNGRGIEDLPGYARKMGLSGAVISSCLQSDANKARINADFELGLSSGVTGTPAMLITSNDSGRSVLVKGLQNAESIAAEIQKFIR